MQACVLLSEMDHRRTATLVMCKQAKQEMNVVERSEDLWVCLHLQEQKHRPPSMLVFVQKCIHPSIPELFI